MKLQDLAPQQTTRNVAKVFESYFGKRFDVSAMTPASALNMLKRVQGLISEHRTRPDFHYSEKNPAYLKLMMMEQGLNAYIAENPMQQVVAVDMNDPKTKAALDKAAKGVNLNPEEQKTVAAVAAMKQEAAKKKGRVMESEVQQAQVVLAAQDMVDRVQGMVEDASEMQFKDLPALVDSMKAEVGTEQAAQFQADAAAALGTLVQSLQTAKTALDGALGVITGQEPVVPGQDDLGAVDTGTGEEDLSAELELPPEPAEEEPEEEPADRGLGRERR